MTTIISIENLSVVYRTGGEKIYALTRLSLPIEAGEIFAVVGESGCGKTTMGLAVAGLLPANADVDGRIMWQGTDLTKLDEDAWRQVRGRHIGFVFQEPAQALNPVLTIGQQLKEVLQCHHGYRGPALHEKATEWLHRVAMPEPERWLRAYPHELSGGLKQRAMFAIALAGEPELLIADEPTTALDVTIQAAILELVRDLRRVLNLTVIWITHDMGVVQELADRVAVMYGGRLMEVGPVGRVLSRPLHPYTRGLIQANPVFAPPGRLPEPIPGHPPDLREPLHGCPFAPRCPERLEPCETAFPEEVMEDERRVACWLYENVRTVR